MVTKLSQDTIQEITKQVSKGVSQHLILDTICSSEDIIDTIEYFRLLFPFTYPEYVREDNGVLLTIDASARNF